MAQDKTITCQDCKNPFVFTAGEQTFFKSKGLTNEPKRCPPCRKLKKARFDQPQPAARASETDDAENG